MREPGSPDFMSLLKRIPDMDVEHAVGAIGGSEPLYEKIMRKMIFLLPSNIEKMDKSLGEDDDLGAFAVMSHGLKGLLNQVGCARLGKRAETLERAAKAGEKEYCDKHYGAFREGLLRFYDQANGAVLQSAYAETDAEAGNACGGEINDLLDALARAKEAAEDYDSILAGEILSPFTKRRFGGNINELIAKAVDALELFKPRQALGYIAELLDECRRTAPGHGMEEGS